MGDMLGDLLRPCDADSFALVDDQLMVRYVTALVKAQSGPSTTELNDNVSWQ